MQDTNITTRELLATLSRIADALERANPAPQRAQHATPIPPYAVYHAAYDSFSSVTHINAPKLSLLLGIDQQKQTLLDNTLQFAKRLPANNALLWGARGTGKSSLIKAIVMHINEQTPQVSLSLIELPREELAALPAMLTHLRRHPDRRFILMIDDISFEHEDASYKTLKSVLDGGLEGRPNHVLLYATSNRRHLMPREMMENETKNAIFGGEAIDEKVSLSDRFGLWLGFHSMSQDTYLEIMRSYRDIYRIPLDNEKLHAEAIAWAAGRGARSGRVAWQCITDLAGRMGINLA